MCLSDQWNSLATDARHSRLLVGRSQVRYQVWMFLLQRQSHIHTALHGGEQQNWATLEIGSCYMQNDPAYNHSGYTQGCSVKSKATPKFVICRQYLFLASLGEISPPFFSEIPPPKKKVQNELCQNWIPKHFRRDFLSSFCGLCPQTPAGLCPWSRFAFTV